MKHKVCKIKGVTRNTIPVVTIRLSKYIKPGVPDIFQYSPMNGRRALSNVERHGSGVLVVYVG